MDNQAFYDHSLFVVSAGMFLASVSPAIHRKAFECPSFPESSNLITKLVLSTISTWPCSVAWPVLSVELNFVPKFYSCSLTRLSQSIIKVFALIIIELSWCLLYLGHGGAVLSPSAHSCGHSTQALLFSQLLFAYPGIDLSNYPGRILTNTHQFFLF